MSSSSSPSSALGAACELAARLEARGHDYALGGAIALGFWSEPRGTVDVDLTLFLPPDKPSECLWILQDVGCVCVVTEALATLREHGHCRVTFEGFRVDVFLPIVDFYITAQGRRRTVDLGGRPIRIWDAETLAVFKMMFFRRKDIADVEGLLRVQRDRIDRGWVRSQLVQLYGVRDPRVTTWDELCGAHPGVNT
jgi:hypothetical protein